MTEDGSPTPREDRDISNEPSSSRRSRDSREALLRTRLPAAATPLAPVPPSQPQRSGAVANLYLLTLLSAADGSLLLLAASGQLSTIGGAVTVGLTIVAGAGAWIAASQAFDGRPRTRRDHATLAALGAITIAATVASVAIGQQLGSAMTLHVLPKAAGLVLMLVAIEVAGWRLPRVARVPAPLWATGAAGALEVGIRWIP